MRGLSEKLGRLYAELADEKNQRAARKVLKELLKVLRHILPKKPEGYLKLGLSDPAATGKLMELFSLLYPYCGDTLEVIPIFDRPELEGRLKLRGRVRLIVPAVGALKLYLDKTIRRFLKGNDDQGSDEG